MGEVSRRKRVLRWVGRLALAGVLATVVLLLLLIALFHTDWAQQMMRDRVETALNTSANGRVVIEDLRVGLDGHAHLTGMVIYDTQERAAVTVDSLNVDVLLTSVLSDTIQINAVTLEGLHVDAHVDDEGVNNLTTLFKPRPPRPDNERTTPPSIMLDALTLQDIDVALTRADGSRVSVDDLALTGHVSWSPDEGLDLTLDNIALAASLTRNDGLNVRVEGLSTALNIAQQPKHLRAHLDPVDAQVHIQRPGHDARTLPLQWQAFDVELTPSQWHARLDALSTGALDVRSVVLDAHRDPDTGALKGPQALSLTDAHLHADVVNTLLPEPRLLTDVHTTVTLAGEPDALDLDGHINTEGGDLTIVGTLDARNLRDPAYTLTITGEHIEPARVVRLPTRQGPPLRTQFTLDAKGHGITPALAELDITLRLGSSILGGIPVDGGLLEARYAERKWTVETLNVNVFKQEIKLAGALSPVQERVEAHVQLKGDLQETVTQIREQTALPIPETLPNVEGQLDVDLRVGAQGMHSIAPVLDPSVDPSTIDAGDVSVRVEGHALQLDDVEVGHLNVELDGRAKDLNTTPQAPRMPDVVPTWIAAQLPFREGDLRGHVRLRNVKRGPLHAERLALALDVAGDDDARRATLTLTGHDVTLGTLTFAHVDVLVEVNNTRLDVHVSADSPQQDLTLSTRARARLDADGEHVHVSLNALEFKRGTLETRLLKPVSTTVPRGRTGDHLTITLPPATFAIAGGQTTLGATLNLDAPSPDEPLTLTSIRAHARLEQLQLARLARLAGRNVPWRGTLHGHVDVEGPLKRLRANVALNTTLRHRTWTGDPLRLEARAQWQAQRVSVKTSLNDAAGTLLTLDTSLPLTRSGGRMRLSPRANFHVDLDAPQHALARWSPLIANPTQRMQRVLDVAQSSLSVHLQGTPAHPTGRVTADVHGELWTRPTLDQAKQRVALDATLGSEANIEVQAWHDTGQPPLLSASGQAQWTSSPLIGPIRGLTWSLDANVGELALNDITPKLQGRAHAHIGLQGDQRNVTGQARVTLTDVQRGALGPLQSTLSLTLHDAHTAIEGNLSIKGIESARVSGTIGVAGKDLLRTRGRLDPPLNIDVEVPTRPLQAWAPLVEAVASLPGNAGATLQLRGTPTLPLVDVQAFYRDVPTLNGELGEGDLHIRLTKDRVALAAALHSTQTPDAEIELSLSTLRSRVQGMLGSPLMMGQLPLTIHAKASAKDLTALVPAFALDGRPLELAGELKGTMDGDLEVIASPFFQMPVASTLRGRLTLTNGHLRLPKTDRRWHNIAVDLEGTPGVMRIHRLDLSERDLERDDRRASIKGALTWDAGRMAPDNAQLNVALDHWLLIGPFDAPRAAITMRADVDASLAQPMRTIGVDVHQLDVLAPQRFKLTHYQERLDDGDIIMLDTPGAARGRLTVKPTPSPPSDDARGWMIDIRLLNPIHVLWAPIDLVGEGNLQILVRKGHKPKISGNLDGKSGEMIFIGRPYRFARGGVHFGPGCAPACLDLHFQREIHPALARDISKHDAKQVPLQIGIVGVIGKQKIMLGGSGNRFLVDVMSAQNLIRQRWLTAPDRPTSQTVQFPSPEAPMVVTFLQTNLPHLLFMDRSAAWADPYDDEDAYGRIEHAEVDNYSESGRRRWRYVQRPPTAGQSGVEIHYDWLLRNDNQHLFGVGLRVGDRVGGGVGVFWEWSSQE